MAAPATPLSDEELATKFHLNATRALPEARATELATLTLALPEATSLTPLTTLLPRQWPWTRPGGSCPGPAGTVRRRAPDRTRRAEPHSPGGAARGGCGPGGATLSPGNPAGWRGGGYRLPTV